MLICKPVINQYYYCSTHLKLDKEKKRQFIIKIPLLNIESIYLFLKQNTKDNYKKMKGLRNLKVQNKSLRQLRFTKKRRLDRAVISTLKLSGWPTNLVFSQLKEYPISLNCYKDIYS